MPTAPTVPQTLGDIYVNVAHLVGLPFLLSALVLAVFAWFWNKPRHSPRQRRAVALAFALWAIGPLAAFVGAMFHFNGENIAQYNRSALQAIGIFDWTNLIGAIIVVVYGKGVRLNVVAACLPGLLLNFAVTYFVACELVAICS